jgi:pimeloyl-ACP methyl ester carboxylesterase
LRERLGESGWRIWEKRGWLEVDDHAKGGKTRVDFGFATDMASIETAAGGFPDVRVPALVVHGRRDEVVDVALSREWARGRSNVRLVEVDDDHSLGATVPLILSETDAFLARVTPRAGALP